MTVCPHCLEAVKMVPESVHCCSGTLGGSSIDGSDWVSSVSITESDHELLTIRSVQARYVRGRFVVGEGNVIHGDELTLSFDMPQRKFNPGDKVYIIKK